MTKIRYTLEVDTDVIRKITNQQRIEFTTILQLGVSGGPIVKRLKEAGVYIEKLEVIKDKSER